MHRTTELAPQGLTFTHITQSNLAINTISEYQSKVFRKFNNSCWNLLHKANRFKLICIIFPQNPSKVGI